MKKIIIDAQSLQAESANRGIGRYSLNLIKNLLKLAPKYKFQVLLNSSLVNLEKVRSELSSYLSENDYIYFSPLVPCHSSVDANWDNLRASEFIYESLISKHQPDLLLITSHVEGFVDNAVSSIARHFSIPTFVVGYDLIPWNHPDKYLSNRQFAKFYHRKINGLINAEMILGISQFVTADFNSKLCLSSCKNISAAVDDFFSRQDYSELVSSAILSKYALHKKFIMYTGGIDFRKNVEGLIENYARLPLGLRDDYDLLVVCRVNDFDKQRLTQLAQQNGLVAEQLKFTGYVSDEELKLLYHQCSLFVFPSFEEGFGLPVLEAMRCGAVVACSNTSSLVEVAGLSEMLFDPRECFAGKIAELLTNPKLRAKILEHSLHQVGQFSWEKTAQQTLQYIDEYFAKPALPLRLKPRLAFISPLPPEQSGIADYALKLIPFLSRHYALTLVSDLAPEQLDIQLTSAYPCIGFKQFSDSYSVYERVLYQLGNSHFHNQMYALIAKCFGVCVLHDVKIGHFINQFHHSRGGNFNDFLALAYAQYGYSAFCDFNEDTLLDKYSFSSDVIKNSLGTIVHSPFNLQQLVAEKLSIERVRVIPQVAIFATLPPADRSNLLFNVVVMGGITRYKGLIEIFEALAMIPAETLAKIKVSIVGSHGDRDYFNLLQDRVKKLGLVNISFSGRVDKDEYNQYLSNADLAIQLRSETRGETSAAILDCFAAGVPVIANEHGTVSDLPDNSLIKINEKIDIVQLKDSIISAIKHPEKLNILRDRAKCFVRHELSPEKIAQMYHLAIEGFYSQFNQLNIYDFKKRFEVELLPRLQLASIYGDLLSFQQPAVYYVDITELVVKDWQSGIQRVVKILLGLMIRESKNFRIEPFYFAAGKCFLAKRTMAKMQNIPEYLYQPEDSQILGFTPGSTVIILDLHFALVKDPAYAEFLLRQREQNCKIYHIIYDLIMYRFPEYFVAEENLFNQYLAKVTTLSDGVICISRSVADEYLEWHRQFALKTTAPLRVGYFHLGADIQNYLTHHSKTATQDLNFLQSKKFHLMVSTLEPRKGHEQVLTAFDELWHKNSEYCLVLVGKRGWNVDDLVARIENHPQLNSKLFWLQGINDQTLVQLYQQATAFIMASYAEGFGLGIVESACYHKPLILRDIAVFREIAGENAFYFSAATGGQLAEELTNWIRLFENGMAPSSANLTPISWRQSCLQLLAVIQNDDWYQVTLN